MNPAGLYNNVGPRNKVIAPVDIRPAVVGCSSHGPDRNSIRLASDYIDGLDCTRGEREGTHGIAFTLETELSTVRVGGRLSAVGRICVSGSDGPRRYCSIFEP